MSLTEEQMTPEINYEAIAMRRAEMIITLQQALAESGKRFNELAEICNKKDILIAKLIDEKSKA